MRTSVYLAVAELLALDFRPEQPPHEGRSTITNGGARLPDSVGFLANSAELAEIGNHFLAMAELVREDEKWTDCAERLDAHYDYVEGAA